MVGCPSTCISRENLLQRTESKFIALRRTEGFSELRSVWVAGSPFTPTVLY
jgi:hypothetical protein